jgi:tyrosyl-tRNA synthetase
MADKGTYHHSAAGHHKHGHAHHVAAVANLETATAAVASDLDAMKARVAALSNRSTKLGGGAPAGSGPGAGILAQVEAAGAAVRDLKDAKASKDDIKAAVEKLLALKAEYKAATGQDVPAPGDTGGKKSKGGAATTDQGKKEKVDPNSAAASAVKAAPALPKTSLNYNRFGQPDTKQGGALSADEKMHFITRNLDEVCKRELIEKVLTEEKRDLKVYWGTATTGRPHIAYFVPMMKIADFLRAGCEVTVLFADIHGYLDNMKSSFELLALRTEYYKAIISALLESIGVSLDKLKFVTGRSFQLTPDYSLDILKLCTLTSQRDAQKAGAEVVKQSEAPPLSGLLYPLLQWLDEEYLGVDCQFGGVDQRKIFMGAEKYLPKIGYKQRAHLMNPMVPGLSGTKMSSSEANSKLDLLDDAKAVKKKINRVFCEEKNVENNPLLSFVKAVLIMVKGDFVLTQRDQPTITYADYDRLHADFAAGKIHPADFKSSVTDAINAVLEPVRSKMQEPAMLKLIAEAYPAEVVEKKGAKKEDSKKPVDPEAAAKAAAGKAAAAASGKPKQKQKQKQQQPKAGKAAPAATAAAANTANDISRINIQVGKIVSVEKHPNADSMYVEKIDLGEPDGPRTVCSGLAGKIPMDALKDRMVVVVTNLKAANLRSIKSSAMLLCATSADGVTECLDPPAGCVVGERITVEGYPGAADATIKPGSSKKGPSVWEICQPDLAVTADKVATWKGVSLMTSKGPLTVATAAGAAIK